MFAEAKSSIIYYHGNTRSTEMQLTKIAMELKDTQTEKTYLWDLTEDK